MYVWIWTFRRDAEETDRIYEEIGNFDETVFWILKKREVGSGIIPRPGRQVAYGMWTSIGQNPENHSYIQACGRGDPVSNLRNPTALAVGGSQVKLVNDLKVRGFWFTSANAEELSKCAWSRLWKYSRLLDMIVSMRKPQTDTVVRGGITGYEYHRELWLDARFEK